MPFKVKNQGADEILSHFDIRKEVASDHSCGLALHEAFTALIRVVQAPILDRLRVEVLKA